MFSGEKTSQGISACIDSPSGLTLTCADSHFIKVRSSFVGKAYRPQGGDCRKPDFDCGQSIGAAQDYFLTCQTLSSCTKPIPPADVLLPIIEMEYCSKNYDFSGEVYFTVFYECMPRRLNFFLLFYIDVIMRLNTKGFHISLSRHVAIYFIQKAFM